MTYRNELSDSHPIKYTNISLCLLFTILKKTRINKDQRRVAPKAKVYYIFSLSDDKK